MREDNWHEARLISTSGIKSVDEQERRAISALLAVVAAVREFGRAVTQPLGAPTGDLSTFVDIPYSSGNETGSAHGLIRVKHAQRHWTALVQVKTGSGRLEAGRLETYLEVAREQRYDAVLTISNEIPVVAGRHPVAVDPRRPPAVGLYHYTWSHLLAEAVIQKEYRGVADPDQAWVLGELIGYLEHPQSGTLCPTGPEVIDLTAAVELGSTATIASMTSARSVSVEPVRPAPELPSRRDLRLARLLDLGPANASRRPEAGWYLDPGDDRRLRWYDGTAWSERTYPAQAALA